MNSIQSLAAVIAGSGLLIFLLAIPLIRRRVPPNAFYGVRTKAAFTSESDWYRINAIGGRYLAMSGLVIFAAGIAGLFVPVSTRDSYFIGAAFVTLLSVIIPCIRLCSLKPSATRSPHPETS